MKRASLWLMLILFCQCTTEDPELQTARKLFLAEQYQEALEITDRLLQESPNNAATWQMHARSLFQLRKFQQVLHASERLIELAPRDPEGYIQRANAKFECNQVEGHPIPWDEVLADYVHALDIEPEDSEVRMIYGGLLNQAGRYKESNTELLRVLQAKFQPYPVHCMLASNYVRLKQRDVALNHANAAVELDPERPMAYEERARIFRELGAFQDAIVDSERCLRLAIAQNEADHLIAYTHNNLGELHTLAGNYKEARTRIDTSLTMLPSNSYAFRNLGSWFHAQHQTDSACMAWNRALDLGFEAEYGTEVSEWIQTHCSQQATHTAN